MKGSTPRYILKLNSARLKRVNWNLTLTIDEARMNGELIALNDSQVLRWLDELNEIKNCDIYISYLKDKIKKLKRDENIKKTRKEIKIFSKQLDELLYKKDYITIVMEQKSDYKYLKENGVIINGIKYKRLLGTTGGVKNKTIVFINEQYIDEINRRINNGRNMLKEISPSKLEAYKSLNCSASIPVSMPKGICVVHDCITHFKSDIIKLDDTNRDYPKMETIKNADIELNDSDGYGMGMPSLMERWSNDLGENYITSGCVIRNSFCKGCVFCVDFQKFAKDNNIKYITDVWGTIHRVENIELILTESMLKLWDSYQSIYMYLYNCKKNNFTFSITKNSENELENVRNMNYQFLQSYEFTDDDIEELIKPTTNEIEDILEGDYRKTILYTKGMELTEKSVKVIDNSPMTALMIDERMKNDPFIKKQIYSMIQKRINQAKVGVLSVPANYSLVSGDPYSLCQSMFELKVTGLLKSGEVYSKYWIDNNVDKIASFRAPMMCHNNIRVLNVVHNEQMDEFYQYMKTPTIFNSWDTCADAMSGFDKDGDAVINTSMDVIVRNTKSLPAIVCVQRKAPKCIPTEDDFYNANIKSFGNGVGGTTNEITTMFEVQSHFEKGSREYNILDYRTKCGQLYQQNEIDKTKGIDSKPIPQEWDNWISNRITPLKGEDNLILTNKEKKQRVLNRKILADKKPYFMRYIYPNSNNKYKQYIQHTEQKCKIKYGVDIKTLRLKENKTKEENEFLDYFDNHYPLGMGDCVINRICRNIENKFDDKLKANIKGEFDYSILKSVGYEYSKQDYKKIEDIYKQYKKCSSDIMKKLKSEKSSSDDNMCMRYMLKRTFKDMCFNICPNENILCNIVLDLCYNSDKSKKFSWDICGDVFIKNLLKLNNYEITFPKKDKNGDIYFKGERFSMKTTKIEVEINLNEKEVE